MLAQLAHDDRTTDPSKAWPDDREWADLGGIEITGPDTRRERGDDVLVFDPILHIRAGEEPVLRRGGGALRPQRAPRAGPGDSGRGGGASPVLPGGDRDRC
ncbi:hypothetical protein ACVGOW_00140 [Pseudonocardia saturnea]